MRPAYAGGGAILAGIGLARFAYVPLFPAMVAAGWVDGAEAGLLGAGNFAGYLIGVLAGRRLAARVGVPRAMDAGMALAVIAFAACAVQSGVVWLLAWRALTGFFLAGIYPVGMKLASMWFPRGLGGALGWLVGALVLGSASPHALRALGASWPWQGVFVAVALAAAGAGVLVWRCVPEPATRAAGVPLRVQAPMKETRPPWFRVRVVTAPSCMAPRV
jgi:MFS family permease